MKEPLIYLFLELANPNKDGQSRVISKTEFVDDYSKLHFTNGCNWMSWANHGSPPHSRRG